MLQFLRPLNPPLERQSCAAGRGQCTRRRRYLDELTISPVHGRMLTSPRPLPSALQMKAPGYYRPASARGPLPQ